MLVSIIIIICIFPPNFLRSIGVFFFLQELLTLHFSGTKLDKKDFLGKSDPFLIFYKANEDNRFVLRNFSNSFMFSLI